MGCRGFVATSTSRLLRELGLQGQAHQQVIKDLSRAAEKGCDWKERIPHGPSNE